MSNEPTKIGGLFTEIWGNTIYKVLIVLVGIALAFAAYFAVTRTRNRLKAKNAADEVNKFVQRTDATIQSLGKKGNVPPARTTELVNIASKLAVEMGVHKSISRPWYFALGLYSSGEIKDLYKQIANEQEYAITATAYARYFRRPGDDRNDPYLYCDLAKFIGTAAVIAPKYWPLVQAASGANPTLCKQVKKKI